MKVYFILDSASNAVKVGKANNIQERMSDLQTGNPNTLKLIHQIECESEKQSFLLEQTLHKKLQGIRLIGEWFRYDESIFADFFDDKLNFERTIKRESLEWETLFGTESFGLKDFPCCFFYPNLTAQIMLSYEDSVGKRVPFRTMKYPTDGKQMLLPYSMEKDKVFISDRKHKENLKLKKFLKSQEIQNSQVSPLEKFLD
jgi:hypothetical protein